MEGKGLLRCRRTAERCRVELERSWFSVSLFGHLWSVFPYLAADHIVYNHRDAFPTPRTRVLPFDHIFPSRDIPASHSPAILYLAELSKTEGDLVAYLKSHAAQTENFRFIVRYRPPLAKKDDRVKARNSLKGYGVEMVLKKTDYLTVDDRETEKSSSE